MRNLWRALGVVAALLCALLAGGVGPAANAATSSGNLIVDGDAEAGYCTGDWGAATTIPGWTVQSGSPDVVCHSAAFSYPAAMVPGTGFFAPGNQGDGSMVQRVDVSGAAATVDAGSATYDLSGWEGGWAAYTGYVQVSLQFANAAGQQVGATATLPTVSATDRGLKTTFLNRSATGAVPAGTRSIQVQVQFLSSASEAGYLDGLSLTLNTPVPAATLTPPVSKVPGYDHVFTVMMENTDYAQVMGDPADTPYLHSLMAKGASLDNYHGVYHPSDENYLAVAGGDTYANGAVYWPNISDPGKNLGDAIEAKGKTWKAYEQGMGAPCNLTTANDKYYEPDDAPFINYSDISDNPTRCKAHLFDTTQLTTDLVSAATTPNFSWIAADDYYDGEASGNGSATSLKTQDGWLQQTLAPVLGSPAWTTQKSLLILTWDESSGEAGNHVATLVLGSQGTVPAGTTSAARYDHYGTARTIEAALGLPGITANDSYATPLNEAFAPVAVPTSTLTTTTPSVSNGSTVTFRYSTPAGTAGSKNWIGVYPVGVTPGSQGSITWQYAPGAGGSLTFNTSSLKGVGSYAVWYLADDGYAALAGPLALTVT